MEDIGQKLKAAREEQGLSIADIEEKTKIQRRYLNSIEEGDFDSLPGDFYVRAFIKQYAEVVGLNGNELLNDFHTSVPMPQPEEYVENSNENKAKLVKETTNNKKGIWKNYIPHAIVTVGILLVITIVYLVYANVFAKPNKTTTPEPDKVIINSKVESSSSKKKVDKKKVEKPAANNKVKFVAETDSALPNTYRVENLPEKDIKVQLSAGDTAVWSEVSFDDVVAWQGTLEGGADQTVDVTQGVKVIKLNLGNTVDLKIKIAGQEFKIPASDNPNAPSQFYFNIANENETNQADGEEVQ